MSQQPNAHRIGLFILTAAAIVVVALFVFGIRKSFERRHPLVTYVPGDVEGLAVGSPVMLRGVNVGQVTALNFAWNRYPGTKLGCVIVDFETKDTVSPVPNMSDKDFGWTVEMQVRAVRQGLRIQEIKVPYHTRTAGKSKISRTISGTVKAGSTILWTIGRELAHELRQENREAIALCKQL